VGSREFQNIQVGDGTSITYVSRPVIACGGGLRIRADSAVIFSATNFSRLIGNVQLNEGPRILTAGRANYFSADGRMVAWEGSPQIQDTVSGTLVEGDTIRLLRASERRPEDELQVSGGRPHAILYPAPADPDSVAALSPDLDPGPAAADSLQADSTVAGADSVTAAPDTTGGAVEEAAVEPVEADSLGAEAAAVDSLGAVPAAADTLEAEPAAVDSLGAEELAPDTVAPLPPDSAAPRADEPPADTIIRPPGFIEEIPAPTPDPEDPDPEDPDPQAPDPGDPGQEIPTEAAIDSVEVAAGDSVRAEPRPFDLVADRIVLRGESYLRAGGTVEVTQDSLRAYADSLEYRQASGMLELRREARLESGAFILSGLEVDLILPDQDIREVQARTDAELQSTDVDMTAPQIRLYLTEGSLDRLVAVDWAVLPPDSTDETGEGGAPSEGEEAEPGPPLVLSEVIAAAERRDSLGPDSLAALRPRAEAEDFVLRADSIEVMAPGQVLDQVVATGAARGESTARDSLNTALTPDALRADWIEGDTIIADFVFVPAPPPPGETSAAALGDSLRYLSEDELLDLERAARAENPGAGVDDPTDGTEGQVTLRRLTAAGNARSLYRLDPTAVEVDTLAADSASLDSLALEAVDSAAADPGEEAGPETPVPTDAEAIEALAQVEPARPIGPLPLHFVTGNRIIIELLNGEVDRMRVDGSARGMYLEPVATRSPRQGRATAVGGGG
jgi:lipopolysaccharide export system protein LptA